MTEIIKNSSISTFRALQNSCRTLITLTTTFEIMGGNRNRNQKYDENRNLSSNFGKNIPNFLLKYFLAKLT